MHVYIFVVAYSGPLARGRYISLSECKPVVRSTCEVGDWLVGVTPKPNRRLVFVFQVSELLTYAEYWRDARFRDRRPRAVHDLGDNRYRPVPVTPDFPHGLRQVPSQRTLIDLEGKVLQSPYGMRRDMLGKRVVVGTRFWFFGDSPFEVKSKVVRQGLRMDSVGQGHLKLKDAERTVETLVALMPRAGVHGGPPTPLSPRIWGYLGWRNYAYTAKIMGEHTRPHRWFDCCGRAVRAVRGEPTDRGHLLYDIDGRPTVEFDRLQALVDSRPGLRKWKGAIATLKSGALRASQRT